MSKINLEKRIVYLENRNKRVETDKAWETSKTRRVLHPWLNAIVPSIGFLLSTLTLPFFKKLWVKYIKRNKL